MKILLAGRLQWIKDEERQFEEKAAVASVDARSDIAKTVHCHDL